MPSRGTIQQAGTKLLTAASRGDIASFGAALDAGKEMMLSLASELASDASDISEAASRAVIASLIVNYSNDYGETAVVLGTLALARAYLTVRVAPRNLT